MSELHPWQRLSAELFEFAIKTSRSDVQVHKLVAFLLLDISVETGMRTYLSLPDGIMKTSIKYFDRRKYAEGNFHELAKGVEASSSTALKDTDLHYARYYHSLRNQLYHQGTGATVSGEDVARYAAVAESILKQLLELDFGHLVQDTYVTTRPVPPEVPQEEFQTLKREMQKQLVRYRELIDLLFEALEPKLIYPTTIKKLADIAVDIQPHSFPSKLREFRALIESSIKDEEIRLWLLGLVSDDVEGDNEQILRNSQFLMELGNDHVALYSLIAGIFFLPVGDVRKDSVDKYDDISFLDSDDYSIMGIYTACSLIQQHFLGLQTISKDYVPVVIRGVELDGKLKITIKRLEALMQA